MLIEFKVKSIRKGETENRKIDPHDFCFIHPGIQSNLNQDDSQLYKFTFKWHEDLYYAV